MDYFAIITVRLTSGEIRTETRVVEADALTTASQVYGYMCRQAASYYEREATLYFTLMPDKIGIPEYLTAGMPGT